LVAINRLTFAVLVGLFYLGCSLGESDLEKAAKEFKSLYGGNWGIVNVSPADRFGEAAISVTYVSKEDFEDLSKALPNTFKGFPIRLSGAMWGIGGLTPDSADTKQFLKWVFTPPYNVGGTQANKELDVLQKKVLAADSSVWTSWSKEQRRKFVSDWIKKERRRIDGFGNCGDKFLLPD
jgi:hypothetical protein